MTKDDINLTKIDIAVRAKNLAQELRQVVGEKNDLYLTIEQLDSILKRACPSVCHHTKEYGFVPEAGCPIHD